MSQKFYPIDYKHKKILVLLIPAAVIISISYYLNLTIYPRIITSLLFFSGAIYYIYISFKDSSEFKSVINKLKNILSKKSEPEEPTNSNDDNTIQ